MPSFRLKGPRNGTALSLILTQGVNSATASVASWGTPPIQGEASFTIEVAAQLGELVAPAAVWLKVTNIQGFDVSEPPGTNNVYDPTSEQITWIWDFGDQPYTPITSPNIPTVWKDLNSGYGKRVAHMYDKPGSYTVTCYGYDRSGTVGVAQFRIGGTNANIAAIANPNTYYPGNRTIVCAPGYAVSDPDAPSGCQFATSYNDALAKRAALGSSVTTRILFKYGATYNDVGAEQASGANFRLGAYGNPALGRPIISATPGTWDFRQGSGYGGASQETCFHDLDFRAPYDSTKQTGIRISFFSAHVRSQHPNNFHRCRWSGWGTITAFNTDPSDERTWFMNDCEVTNWQNYGMFLDSHINPNTHIGLVGCDIHQDDDALSGYLGRAGSGLGTGNQHTALRYQIAPNVYFDQCSFFNRSGWSINNPSSNTANFPPTAEQPPLRLMQGRAEDATWATMRPHHMYTRCTVEGGFICISGHRSLDSNPTLPGNYIFDKILMVPGPNTERIIWTNTPWIMRNIYVYMPNSTKTRTRLAPEFFLFDIDTDTLGQQSRPCKIYNSTVFNAKSTANGGYTSAPALYTDEPAPYVGTQAWNNILHAPNYTSPLSPQTTFAPLGTSGIAGFTPRHKGAKWSPPYVEVTAGSVRVGGSGNVAVGEQVSIPYPDNRGRYPVGAAATVQTTQAFFLARTNTFDQVVPGDASAVNSAQGQITVTFNASDIRITNTSGFVWNSTDVLRIILDYSDYLMDFQSGTATPVTSIPLASPQSGSSALGAAVAPFPYDDFLGNLRTTSRDVGAFEVA